MGVYLLRNLINGKIYIGKTNNFTRRFQAHKDSKNHKFNRNSIISKAISKYGWNNFSIKILESYKEVENDILLEIEKYWINEYNSTDRTIGYNLVKEGAGMMGYRHTQETKDHLSKVKSGISKPENYNKNLWKAVKQIDIQTNETIKIWESSGHAARGLNSPGAQTHIGAVCRKYKDKRKNYVPTHAIGFRWEFV